MLPDTVAAGIAADATAVATTDSGGANGTAYPLQLKRLSAHTENGSLVQATFHVHGDSTPLRSGGVVSVELRSAASPTISVPASALMPAAERGSGSVFVLDDESQRLVRRTVRIADSVMPGGRIAVTSGLAPGEVVIVAGTAFLSEGQRAVKHDAQTMLHGSGA